MKKQFLRYADKGINKIGFLDIETQGFGFSANKSNLVSWVLEILDIKTNKIVTYYDIVTKEELKRANKLMKNNKRLRKIRPRDKRILQTLIDTMKKCDLIVTHYGTWFDIPMIRTRSKMQGLKFLKHSDKIRFSDTWRFAKNGLKLDRNTLDLTSKTMNVPQTKTKIDYFFWELSNMGDKIALQYVLKHNFIDVTVTRKTWLKLETDFPISARYY